MKLLKLDFGAERRPLEIFAPLGKQYYDVECPFCGRRSLVYFRNFSAGFRCHNTDCRAMLRFPTKDATRDLLPANETKIVHGLRTRLSYEPATLEEAFGFEPKKGGAE